MDRKASSKNKKIRIYNMGGIFMEIKLNEKELMIVSSMHKDLCDKIENILK